MLHRIHRKTESGKPGLFGTYFCRVGGGGQKYLEKQMKVYICELWAPSVHQLDLVSYGEEVCLLTVGKFQNPNGTVWALGENARPVANGTVQEHALTQVCDDTARQEESCRERAGMWEQTTH